MSSEQPASREANEPTPAPPHAIDWSRVRRVLVVRLRSIGDTVLITPALRALREFLPAARIEVLLEDWVAPLLEGHDDVDRTIKLAPGSLKARLRAARELRAAKYDVAFNLHAGTTAAWLTCASGATHRVAYAHARLKALHNIIAPPASVLWGDRITHTAERHLELMKWAGVPVRGRVPARLSVSPEAERSLEAKLRAQGLDAPSDEIALIHPAAAFESKQWATENFARIAEQIYERGFTPVAVGTPSERIVLESFVAEASAPVAAFSNLTLPEVTALAKRARVLLGNDSGIAHIAAAVGTPSVVIFGSSDPAQWSPYTDAPAEIVRAEASDADELDPSLRVARVSVRQVAEALARVLERSRAGSEANRAAAREQCVAL